MTGRNASETAEQQQDWCPNHTKHKPEKCRTSPKERLKKLEGSMPKPCEIRSKSRWKTIFCPQLRNTRTAAGLKPKPYETQAEKCRTSPKERIKKLAGSIPKPCEIWSKSRWKTIFCPQLRNTRTAAGLMPKPYETQARCPNHAKYDRKADGKQSFVRSCETLEQQQDWCPNHTKHKPENCRTSPKERIKKLAGSIPKPCGIDAQTIRNTSQKSAERHLRNALKS